MRFLQWLGVARPHIVAIAVLATLTFGWAFTGEYLWLAAVACGLDWFVVNLLNRVVDLEEDERNGIKGVRLVRGARRGVVVAGVAVLAGSLVVGHVLAPGLTPFRLGYHALGLAYNWPIGPRRLKECYALKNVASACGFLLTCFAYPLSSSTALVSDVSVATVALTGAFFFLFELSYEVIYDLRDVEGDRAVGVPTFPVVHGTRTAIRIVDVLVGASAGCLVLGYGAGVVPWRVFVMLAAPVLQLILYKRWLRRGILARDCVNLTWIGAALLLAYHLWILAGLPT